MGTAKSSNVTSKPKSKAAALAAAFPDASPPDYNIAVIDRTLDILEALARIGPASLAALAETAGCTRTAGLPPPAHLASPRVCHPGRGARAMAPWRPLERAGTRGIGTGRLGRYGNADPGSTRQGNRRECLPSCPRRHGKRNGRDLPDRPGDPHVFGSRQARARCMPVAAASCSRSRRSRSKRSCWRSASTASPRPPGPIHLDRRRPAAHPLPRISDHIR